MKCLSRMMRNQNQPEQIQCPFVENLRKSPGGMKTYFLIGWCDDGGRMLCYWLCYFWSVTSQLKAMFAWIPSSCSPYVGYLLCWAQLKSDFFLFCLKWCCIIIVTQTMFKTPDPNYPRVRAKQKVRNHKWGWREKNVGNVPDRDWSQSYDLLC